MNFILFSYKANWSVTNLRPASPIRPYLKSSGPSSNAKLFFSASSQTTYEEDALVLRVIETYCAAFQSTSSRNTVHAGKFLVRHIVI